MFRVRGVCVDLIEVFTYHVLVQEVETGQIYLVPLEAFDSVNDKKDSENTETSNIISMRGWVQWQEGKKASYNKSKIKRKQPEPQPQLAVILPIAK